MPIIEQVFRCRIDYDVEHDHVITISDKAHKWARASDVHCTTVGGGPAWNAYLILESSDSDTVLKVATKVESYIKRFRGARILD